MNLNRLEDQIVFAPYALLDLWTPGNVVSWALKGIVSFVVVMVWMFTVVWWAGPLLAITQKILGSYRQMKRRRDRRY